MSCNKSMELENSNSIASASDNELNDQVDAEILRELNVESIQDLKKMGIELKGLLRESMPASRSNVLMVRVRDSSSRSIDALVEAQLFRSRSEAAAFLIKKGLEATAGMFKEILDKSEKIRQLKSEIRGILGTVPDDVLDKDGLSEVT